MLDNGSQRHKTLPDMIVINVNCLEPSSTMSPTQTRRDKMARFSFAGSCSLLNDSIPAYHDEWNVPFERHSNGFETILTACWKLVLGIRNVYQHMQSLVAVIFSLLLSLFLLNNTEKTFSIFLRERRTVELPTDRLRHNQHS